MDSMKGTIKKFWKARKMEILFIALAVAYSVFVFFLIYTQIKHVSKPDKPAVVQRCKPEFCVLSTASRIISCDPGQVLHFRQVIIDGSSETVAICDCPKETLLPPPPADGGVHDAGLVDGSNGKE